MSDLPRGKWLTFNPMSHARLPAAAGVYVVYVAGEPVYVGQSSDIRMRFAAHKFRYGFARNIKTPWGDVRDDIPVFVKVKLSRRMGDWAMWEIRLIHRLKPRHNGTFKGMAA